MTANMYMMRGYKLHPLLLYHADHIIMSSLYPLVNWQSGQCCKKYVFEMTI